MEVAIKSLKLLKAALASSDKLRELMNNGNDISPGITTKPRLNLTALSKEKGLNSYITLSYNKVEAYESHSAYYLKVNVVTDAIKAEDPAALVLAVVGEVNRIITRKELEYGFGEQFVFGEMEESYFDLDQMTWGYVIIYATSDEPI